MWQFVLCAIVWSQGPAAAQQSSDEERARQHYEAGRSYFDRSRYGDAVREFEEAHRLSGRAHLLLNVATSHERLGALPEAVRALERYLEQQPDAADRRSIEDRMRTLRERIAAATPTEDNTAELTRVTPPDTRSTPSDRDDDSPSMVGPIVVLSIGGASAVGAVITGLMAHSRFQELEDGCPADRCPSDVYENRDSGRTLAVVSTVLTGVAIAGVGAGLLWLLLSGSEDEASEPPVALSASPDGFFARARVSFE